MSYGLTAGPRCNRHKTIDAKECQVVGTPFGFFRGRNQHPLKGRLEATIEKHLGQVNRKLTRGAERSIAARPRA